MMERLAGIEPASRVWRTRALPLCYSRFGGAGCENRTRVSSLEGCRITTMLNPHRVYFCPKQALQPSSQYSLWLQPTHGPFLVHSEHLCSGSFVGLTRVSIHSSAWCHAPQQQGPTNASHASLEALYTRKMGGIGTISDIIFSF